jgi:lipopolysaccharide/colanic/teichoic acid biosynthesis glycosyltransferase
MKKSENCMVELHKTRRALVLYACVAGLVMLDGTIILLMSGEHPVVDYVFGQSQWSLLTDSKEQTFLLTLNVMFVSSLLSFFWVRQIPTSDDIGKAILHVAIIACLAGLFLAFSRIGIVSRIAFVVTIVQIVFALLASDWLISKIRPFVLLDCSEPPLGDALVRGVKIRSISKHELGDRRIDQKNIDGIVVGGQSELALDLIRSLVWSDIKFFDRGELREQMLGRLELDSQMTPEMFVFSQHKGYLLFRRIIDVFVSLTILPFGVLILFIFGSLIRIEGPGSFLFVQRRVGKGGKSFNFYKLRTMIPEDQARPTFASENSHRITRIGRLARRWRIDEIPQFWNVLIGDMTLIGPRPEQVEFVSEYEAAIPFYGLRHRVRPGLTGWAQVKQGYAEGQGETRLKLAYDVYYIKHASPWLDSLILLKTFYFVIRGG